MATVSCATRSRRSSTRRGMLKRLWLPWGRCSDSATVYGPRDDRLQRLDAAERVRRDAARGRRVGDGAGARLGGGTALGGPADRDDGLRTAPAVAPGAGLDRIHRPGSLVAA